MVWMARRFGLGPMATCTSTMTVVLATFLLAFSSPTPGAANEASEGAVTSPLPRATYTARAIHEEIKVDGRLDEAAWSQPATAELLYETRPAENGPAPVRTEVWIAYDPNNLYIAFRAHDPEPDRIRARLSDRDAASQDDFVGVVLDTFNDERRAFEFFVNPLGVQMDMTQNEMTGEEDDSWDAIWDSAGRTTDTGYTVEMRVPFSSLRFPDAAGGMTWGLDAVRIYPRDQRYRIGLQPLERGNNCYLCQASKLVGLEGVAQARSIELDPTLTASLRDARADFPHGRMEGADRDFEPGITARWGLTPNLVLSSTLNPDFSQVEADAAQLDVNTQFALYYPEKRPFFLEGGDIFATRFNAIYSRDIADPDWGVKLTGKMGSDALGVIIAQDRTTNFLIPSSQSSDVASLDEGNLSSIVRYRRDLFGATTGGLFYTGREGEGFYNRLFGGDVLFRWKDTEAARIELLGSQSLYPTAVADSYGQSTGRISGHALRAVYQHTSRDWMYYVLYRDVGEGFRADLGFVPQVDFREGAAALERAFYPEGSAWSQVRVGVEWDDYQDQGGQHLSRRVEAYTWGDGPRETFFRFSLIAGDLFYGDRLFDTDRVSAYVEAQAFPSVYAALEVTAGDQVDFANGRQAQQLRLDPSLRLHLGRHLRVNLDHSYEKLDVDAGHLYTARLSQIRATYQFGVRTFARWIAQYQDIERNPAAYESEVDVQSRSWFNQVLFSYKINPQTVLFLGYSDRSLGDQDITLTRESRTVFFKVGYAVML